VADLLVTGHELIVSEWQESVEALNLYCWQHRTVHAFPLADVERIIYALGAETIDGYDGGYRDGWNVRRVGGPWGSDRTRLTDDPPDCLKTVLRGAGDDEVYAEHVEQGVECRKAAPPT